jgi:hypothetical protein
MRRGLPPDSTIAKSPAVVKKSSPHRRHGPGKLYLAEFDTHAPLPLAPWQTDVRFRGVAQAVKWQIHLDDQ